MSDRPFRLITRRKSIVLLCAGAAGSFANAFIIEPSLDGLRVGVLVDLHFKPDTEIDHDSLRQA